MNIKEFAEQWYKKKGIKLYPYQIDILNLILSEKEVIIETPRSHSFAVFNQMFAEYFKQEYKEKEKKE